MLLLYKKYSDDVGFVKDLALIGRPGVRASLFSLIGLTLGLPLRIGGEDDSSPLFDDDERGLRPGFMFSTLARDALYLSRW